MNRTGKGIPGRKHDASIIACLDGPAVDNVGRRIHRIHKVLDPNAASILSKVRHVSGRGHDCTVRSHNRTGVQDLPTDQMDAFGFDGTVVSYSARAAFEDHRMAAIRHSGMKRIVRHIEARGHELRHVHRRSGSEDHPGGIHDENPAVRMKRPVEYGRNASGAYPVEHRRSAALDDSHRLIERDALVRVRIEIAPVNHGAVLGVDDRVIAPLGRYGAGRADHVRRLEGQPGRYERL
jgi:hypothetical protein